MIFGQTPVDRTFQYDSRNDAGAAGVALLLPRENVERVEEVEEVEEVERLKG